MRRQFLLQLLVTILFLGGSSATLATDHNEPNSVNGIFSDVDPDSADLYGLFAYPGKIVRKSYPYDRNPVLRKEYGRDQSSLDSLVLIMTYAPEPATGVFDPDVKHVFNLYNAERVDAPDIDTGSTADFIGEGLIAAKNRVKNLVSKIKNNLKIEISYFQAADTKWYAKINYINFPYHIPPMTVPANETLVYSDNLYHQGQNILFEEKGLKDKAKAWWDWLVGNTSYTNAEDSTELNHIHVDEEFSKAIPGSDKEATRKEIVESSLGAPIRVFVGGRDDPFFTDLNGFFRSTRYRPYLDKATKNQDFQLNSALLKNDGTSDVDLKKIERGTKSILEMAKVDPNNPNAGSQDPYWRGADGKQLSLTYSARDDRAGYNVNAIALEIPLKLISKDYATKRLIRVWGESYRLKAKDKRKVHGRDEATENSYVRVDTLGIPFVDTVLGQRQEKFNSGYQNLSLQADYTKRLIHLGRAFAPGLEKAGYSSCFHLAQDNKSYFPKDIDVNAPELLRYGLSVETCLTQRIRMADNSWKLDPKSKIKPPVVYQLFFPNTLTVDLDTTGTWPFGRRPEDQVASRFTSLFLDFNRSCGSITGNEHICNVDSFQAKPANDAVRGLPINPAKNDVEFLQEFPYLAPPHAREYEKRTKEI